MVKFGAIQWLGLATAGTLAAWASLGQAQTLPDYQKQNPYYVDGAAQMKRALSRTPNTGPAKNVILFIGDGMGISTIVASRIFEGQQRKVDGESNSLSFERLPNLALSKTYSSDTQVTDSAASITAIMTGVKTRNKVIGLDGSVTTEKCEPDKKTRLTTLAELAKSKGKAAGVVTTTRVTHATPAGAYGHTPYRDWEGDSDMPPEARSAGCLDIARQLVEAPGAIQLDVALGGGRSRFLAEDKGGKRTDGKDLTAAWVKARPNSAYVTNVGEMKALPFAQTDHLLGLFANEHLPYEAERAVLGEGVPTLTEMTTAAIDILSKNQNGYFLMVEGGKIDMANHLDNAYRAVTETVEFSRAISAALAKIDLNNTLVIVTADHSHGLVISGYAPRNAPILGLAGNEGEPAIAMDGKAYTTLSYATGPNGPVALSRDDPAQSDLDDPDYRQTATVALPSSAHSGEDVAIFADGPQAYLFQGVVEESYIFQVMRRALIER